ncbi:MAG: CDP-2,3-bis-(O-geranylgeranyl)-sn-glycerol synthase [Candidatus Micrarchaeota archaeon]
MDYVGLVLFALPAYIANGAPVLFGGGRPVDGGAYFYDGRRLFGDSKTVRGLVSGVAAGMAAAVLLAYAVPALFLPQFPFATKMLVAFLLSAGTLCGDLLGSFLKRRMGLTPGEHFFITDQVLFFAVALAFSSVVYLPSYDGVLYLFIVTFALHILSNMAAHRLKLKNVPW